jgi:hypothetical protein
MVRSEGMDNLSRRDALKVAGGVLGALGVVSVARAGQARAQAQPPWTWPSSGSVAGTGDGADPQWLWDPVADPVMARVLAQENVPLINALLGTWTTNAQPLPFGLPGYLRDFMEQARQLPSWTDQGKLADAFQFIQKRGLYLGLLYGLDSGMLSCAIPHEARAVYYSQGGAAMRDRITKTAKLGYDIGTQDAYQPAGSMIVTCVKTRMVHAAVRNLLPQSPYWSQVTDEKIPISQRDLLVTWNSLPTTAMQKMTAWRVPIAADESAAFLHTWQVAAHMLGVMDEYIPASWDSANAQAAQVLTPVLAPTAEGANLANILINLGDQIDAGVVSPDIISAFTRYLLGDQIAGWLQIPSEPVWEPLIETFWPPFVAVREGLLELFPGTQDLYWAFDEFLRQAALIYLSEGTPISIQIPTTNRPT